MKKFEENLSTISATFDTKLTEAVTHQKITNLDVKAQLDLLRSEMDDLKSANMQLAAKVGWLPDNDTQSSANENVANFQSEVGFRFLDR